MPHLFFIVPGERTLMIAPLNLSMNTLEIKSCYTFSSGLPFLI